MKKQQLIPVLAIVLLALLTDCKLQPRHPEAINPPLNEQSVREYIRSEYDYTENWLSQYNTLRAIIKEELSSRFLKLPEPIKQKSDTAIMEGGRWRVYIHERKEIRAQSGGSLKTVYRLVASGSDSVFIEDFLVVNLQCLVLLLSNNLSTSIEITDIFTDKKSGAENKINFPEPEGNISGLSYDKENDRLEFVYSSCVTPPTCYAYGIHSMHLGILWKSKIQSFAREDYKAQILFMTGLKGRKIPVSVVKKIDEAKPDKPAPVAVFADCLKPGSPVSNFNPALLCLLNRGFTIVRLHIPDGDTSVQRENDLISDVVSSLVHNGIASPGMITLVAAGPAATMAYICAQRHSSWFKTLVLENPPSLPLQAISGAPFCLINSEYNNAVSENIITGFVQEYRKKEKSENILLINKGKNINKDRAYMGDVITFILVSNEIDK